MATDGNLENTTCRSVSNDIQLSIKNISAAALSVVSNKAFVCPGEPAILTANGGLLGSNASWKWYQQNCNGTYIGTGNNITVYPLATTSYFVKADGDCNITQCVFVTMPQLCILANESVDLKGALGGQTANLVFSVVSDKKIQSVEVERSFNGIDFTVVRNLSINDYADKKGYSIKDNIGVLAENIFYYRIKVNGNDGAAHYSKILQLSRNGNDFKTTVSPNPANENTKVGFYTDEASKVEIRLFNTQGQLVRRYNTMSVAGTNSFHINGLDKLSAGIYSISITDAAKTSHTKLLIQR
ncbi:hypothetical protein BH10BAC2_BH10BAC2_44560 [soil metagenome]